MIYLEIEHADDYDYDLFVFESETDVTKFLKDNNLTDSKYFRKSYKPRFPIRDYTNYKATK